MRTSIENIEEEIRENGLPSKEEMRAALEAREHAETFITLQSKLFEYKKLFNRFKEGGDFSGEEKKKMLDLSDELQKLAESQRSE